MALILRLQRALVSTSTSAVLLRPAATASAFRLLPPAYFALLPLSRPWLLPGAAVGFRSTAADWHWRTGLDGLLEEKDDEILCDYNHWLITMKFPDPQPSREEMIETYLQTLAQVVGSYEEAKKKMYAFSTTTYTGFQAVMTEEMSEKFRGLPGVVFILPDSILYPETKEYGGDKYDNGVITPSRPCYHWGKSQRNDKNGNSQGN